MSSYNGNRTWHWAEATFLLVHWNGLAVCSTSSWRAVKVREMRYIDAIEEINVYFILSGVANVLGLPK